MNTFLFAPGIAVLHKLANETKLPLLSALHLAPCAVLYYLAGDALSPTQATAIAALTLLAVYSMASFYLQAKRGSTLLLGVIERMSKGDLTATIDTRLGGHFGSIMRALEAVNRDLGEIVAQVRASSDSVSHAAREISSGNSNLSERTEHQAATLEQTASGMAALAATVRANASSCQRASGLAREAESTARDGAQAVHGVVTSMDAIESDSRHMADIIEAINGIAFQTNILALNAAVEAARAGDQGRGFAVVAAEVRALAQRSAEAAKQISSLIEKSVEQIANGNRGAKKAGAVIDEIVGRVQQTSGLIDEISSASGKQANGVDEIKRAITQLEQMTQQNAALVEQAAAATEAFEEEARRLGDLVSRFQIATTVPTTRASVALVAMPRR